MTLAAASVPAAHARLIRKETIVNTLATAVIAALLTFVLFGRQERISVLAGPPGGIFGILPGTFNFTLLVTLALTLITRRRVLRGEYSSGARGASTPWQRALAGNVVLRSVELALALTLALVPLTYTLVRLAIHQDLCRADWPFGGLLAFFVVYFCVLSLIVTPTVVRRALAD